jgi:hypothetical protein
MYNIRIKSVPNKAKTGSQLDYSLVDRNTLFLKPNTPVDSDVKNTMGAVPREKANIEAEGGETIVGDINNDGYLEHQTIVGKRHTQGGVPLNVPEGSFIFSDTKKMIIKDPEILAMFGMKPSKKGYTPAEIAKKYNINDYIAILKDPAKDSYSKETAQIMLNSNLKKLGMLALVQESMKGFPDGVPAIAESVMESMMGGGQESSEQEFQEGPQAPQEEMQEQPQQRYGGTQLPKAQVGYSAAYVIPASANNPIDNKVALPKPQATVVKNNTKTSNTTTTKKEPIIPQPIVPKVGNSFYINNQPNQITEKYKGFYGDEWVVFKKPIKVLNADGNEDELTEMKVDDWNIMTKNGVLKAGHDLNVFSPNSYTDISNIGAWSQPSPLYTNPGIKYNSLYYSQSPITLPKETNSILQPGYEYVYNNATYKVLEPNTYDRDGRDAVKVAQIKDPNRNIGSFFDTDFGTTTIPIDEYLKMFGQSAQGPMANPDGTAGGTKVEATTPSDSPVDTAKGSNVVTAGSNKKEGKVIKTVRSFPKDTNRHSFPTTGGFSFLKPRDTLRYGGIPHMAEGGSGPGNGSTSYNPDTNTMDTYDASGKLISSVPYTGTSFNVKNKDIIERARAAGYNVESNPSGTKNNYIPEQTQKTGFKVNQKSGFYEAPGYEIGEKGFNDFHKFWSPELQGYTSATGKGPEAWKTDFLKAQGAESEASRYLGTIANQQGIAAGFGPQLDVNQKNKQGKSIAFIPGNQYYNLKKFNKTPVTPTPIIPEIPEKKDDVVKTNPLPGTPPYTRRSWSKPATLNFMNAFGSRIYRGDPVMQRFKGYTPDYVLPDPAQAIAHVLSGASAINNTADNTMSGNVAFGAKLGTLGQALDQTTKIQSDYDNAGAGIYNNAQAQGAQAIAATDAANQKANYQYNNDRQVLDQNYTNSLNKRNSNMYKASILGNVELANMDALASMLPQVGFDYWNKNIGWSGNGRDYSIFDPYQNPFGNGSAGSKGVGSIDPDYDTINAKANSVYESSYKTARKTMTEEDARAYARQAALGVLKMKTGSNATVYSNNTPRNVYNQMFNTSPQYADQDNDVSQG